MKTIKHSWVMLVCGLVFLSGCAFVSEKIKRIEGVSIAPLEDARGRAAVKTINYDYFSCYTRSLDILKNAGSYVYAKGLKKDLIAIYVSELDTTPVGLFFTEKGKDSTQLEIASPSDYARDLISKKVFEELEKQAKVDKALNKVSGESR